jgi:hypothetical protein
MLAALKSWKTTAASVVAAIGVAAQVVVEMAEAPAKWRLIAMIVNAVALAVLGAVARDNSKTSEDVGAAKTPGPIVPDDAVRIPAGADAEAISKAVQAAVTSALALRKAGGAPPEPPQ